MAHDDEFGYHEVLHTTHVFSEMWTEHIRNHGLMKHNDKLRIEAEWIENELARFYQLVAQESDRKFEEATSRLMLRALRRLTAPLFRLWR